MQSVRILKDLNQNIHFLTFTVVRWYYLLDRHNRWDILLDCLKFCQKHKQLKIYHWVFMLNHIHLIVQCPDMSGFVRDFKSYTSKELKKNILATEPHVLNLFITNDNQYHFWQDTSMPEPIFEPKFYLTKAHYIEMNPVRKGYVNEPGHWKYSSANKTSKLLQLEHLST